MNKIYLKTALRSLKKNKAISFINILGLAIGITVCLIIYQYVAFELSYDKFNEDSSRLYRIERDPFCSIAPSFIPLLYYIPAGRNGQGLDIPASSHINFTLRKVEDIHLNSHKLNEVRANSDISYIYLFSALAVLIIAIACINFFNLLTATIDKRFNETGVKKIFGIKRVGIYFQFFFESFLLVAASTVIALFLNQLVQPFLKSFLGVRLIHPVPFYLALAGLVLLLSVVTGFVPGNYLARLKPVRMLKNSPSSQSGYRNILVVFQFVAAIGLFIITGVIYRQMEFIRDKDLGFDKENIVLIPAQDEIINNWGSIYQQLLTNPNIKEASLSKNTIGGRLLDAPGLEINLNGNWEGWPEKIPHIRTGYNFFKIYGIKIIAGRDFDKNIVTDNTDAFILNESAVKKVGIKDYNDIIGAQVRTGGRTGKVIGVVNDFNYESLHNPIIPMVTYISLNSANTLSVKVNQSSVNQTIAYIKDVLDGYLADYQFTYSFFDNRLASQYINERKMMFLTGYASVFAILIAGLGLLGLSLFFTERKTKEIGIRKVNGAKISEVMAMLNKDFVKWVAIAFVIVTPVAYYAMHKWLENFAYKTTLSWWIFALAGVLALGIALLTVSWQSWKAATRNPVESLRYE